MSASGPKDCGQYQQLEIEYGPFQRQVTLAVDVDPEQATATYERGFLTIKLPIAPKPAPAERIAIVVTSSMSETLNDTIVEEPTEELTFPATLPVLPLKDTVVFPESVTPLAIGQERSIKLVEDVVSGDRVLALVTVKNPEAEQPGWDDLYEVGTAAVIHKMIKVPDGTLRILVQGVQRIKLDRPVQDDPYLVGEFVELPDELKETPEVEALTRNVQNLFGACHRPRPLPARGAADRRRERRRPERALQPRRLHAAPQDRREAAAARAHRHRSAAAGHLGHPQPRARGVRARDRRSSRRSRKRWRRASASSSCASSSRRSRTSSARAIPRQAEIAELRRRFESMELPEDVRKVVDRELARLERLPTAAAEYGVIRTYIDWIASLPWHKTTEDNLDLDNAKQVLDEDHFDLEKVKERILEHLAVSKLKNDTSGPILCFVGPPGVGKTSLGQSISRALGRKFARLSVGGVRDEAEIRGHRRTYIGAMPGTIIRHCATPSR